MSSAWSASLAATITSHRRRRGLSQRALASHAGIPQAALIALEGGQYNPTLGTVENIATALTVPVTSLLAPPACESTRRIPNHRVHSGDPVVERLGRYPAGLSWEFWRLGLPPHDAMQGPLATEGAVRLLHMVGGVLHAGPSETPELLFPGDSIEFATAEGHVYAAGPEGAEVFIALGMPTHPAYHPRD